MFWPGRYLCHPVFPEHPGFHFSLDTLYSFKRCPLYPRPPWIPLNKGNFPPDTLFSLKSVPPYAWNTLYSTEHGSFPSGHPLLI